MTAPVGVVVVEADGGSRGNPGPAGYGAVVLADDGSVLAERNEFLGVVSNNVAEYRGLIAGLQAAAELGAAVVHVRMDSKLVVEQMSGRWQVKHPAMRPLAREAAALVSRFASVQFEWIPRAQNTRADRLANAAMDEGTGRAPRATRAPTREPETSEPASSRPSAWVPSGSATRLVLVRHGSTEHSAERRFSGRNDLPLNSVGQDQARALALRFAGQRLGAVIASPLRRCQETAQAIAEPHALALETVEDLAEVDFGDWEGRTFAEARAEAPAALDAWLADPDAAPPRGESFAVATRRVRRGRDSVIAAHPGETVLVVTHVTPIKVLVRLALEAPPMSLFRIHLDTASVSIIEYFADGNCSVRLVNDTSHLGRGAG